MAKATLKTVAKLMKDIDFGMLTTIDGRGVASSRPMSNNGDVEYNGTSYFFALAKTETVKQIKKNPLVSIQMSHIKTLGKNVFIHVAGRASLKTDRASLEEHWVPSLKVWFPEGVATKGLTLIAVEAKTVRFWIGGEEGEYTKSRA